MTAWVGGGIIIAVVVISLIVLALAARSDRGECR